MSRWPPAVWVPWAPYSDLSGPRLWAALPSLCWLEAWPETGAGRRVRVGDSGSQTPLCSAVGGPCLPSPEKDRSSSGRASPITSSSRGRAGGASYCVCPRHFTCSPAYKSQRVRRSVVSDSLWPHGLGDGDPRLLCPWDSPARILEWVAMPSSRGLSQPRDRTCTPRSSVLTEVFTAEPPGKPQDDSSSFQTLWGGDGECALHGNLYPGGIQGPPLPLGIAYFLKPPISGVTAVWNGQPRSSPGQHPSGPLFWNQSQA